MTPEQYNENLTKLYGLVSGDLAKDTIYPAAIELLASIKFRIRELGKNSAGGNIGNYSTKPMYASRSQFVKGGFKAGGKATHEQRFFGLKTVKSANKTMYLAEGYKELRDVQGLRTDIVNLAYRGDLLASYQSQKIGQYVILGFTTELSVLKRGGLEKKYGDVFHATPEEKEKYIAKVNFSMARITRNTIAGINVTAEID